MPVLLALVSAVVYGIGDWCGGRASRVQPSVLVALVGQIVSLLLVLVGTALMGTPVPAAATWWWSGVGGAVGALGIAGLYHAFANGDASVVAPVSAVAGAALPVVVGLAGGERPSALALTGVAIAVAAVALVSGAVGERHHSTPPRIVVLALVVGCCFGFLFVALDKADSDAGLWPLLIARLVSIPTLALLAGVRRARPQRHAGSVRLAVTAGVLDMGANLTFLMATRAGMLSVVGVVASLYPASTVALAFAVDNERVNRWQAAGMALAAVALVMVGLSRN